MALNYVIIVPLGARSPEYPYPRTVQASMAGHAPTLIRSAIPPSTDIPAYDDPLLGVSLSTARRDVPVTDGNSLAAALLNAQPGDTIILEEGRTYTQNESIRAIGTATQPIIIKGSTGAAWNGVVRLYGQYIYLMGVDLSTGAEGVVVLAGFCNKILACKFGNQEASNAISLDRVVDVPDNRGGRYGEIAYCDFGTQGPNPPWQPGDDFPGFRQQIKMFTDSVYNPSADKWGWDSAHIDGWIHHNNFHDSHPKADPGTYSSGDNDIIEFGEGDSQEWVYTLSTNWYVEYNIFQNNNNAGNALIDFKTRGNICRGNTCIGNFSQGFWSRTGGAIQYISNWMDYTWGRPYLTLRDSNNIAIKNYMDGGQIDDFSGDRPYDTYPRGSWGQYPCAFNSKIMSNTGGCDIHVGEKFSNQGELPAHAENTLIEDQATNSISFRAVDGTPQYLNPIDNRFDPPSINAPDAVQLTTADVGPDAITNAPLSWSSPRGVGTISQGEAVYVSSFETGAIQDQNVSPDGWNEQTMLSNCPGHLYCVPGRDYSYSSQVLPSATDTGVGTVLPRAGNYFWRAEIREGDNPLDGDHSPRSQLKIGSQSPGRIKYGVKSWVQLSIYRPSARASVFDNEDLTLFQMSFYPEPTDQSLIAMQFEYVNNAHAPSKGWTGEGHIFTLRYFDGNSVVLVPHADLGRSNQIPTFADEWVDWRLELKSHATNGEAKLWYRRPEAENVWVQVVDIKSSDNVEIGWVGKDYLSSISCYGGPHTPPVDGSVYVPSIVCYFDEFRVSDETAGTIESVEITSSPQVSPVTPGASQQSIDLLQQITEFPRLPRQIFSGHHVASFHSANDVPNAWDDTFEPGGYIYELHQLTGVWPWLWGVNWDAAWVGEVHDYAAANTRIINHHASGGCTEIMIHARVPGNEALRWDDYDAIDIEQLLTPGTSEYNGWRKMLDEYAVGHDGTTGLKQLRNAGVPIIYRPFHEFNRTSYWWSYNNPTMTGPRFIELWRQTFDYLTTDHGLNNLLWFWTPTVGAGMSPQNTENYYPGSNYVDFIGVSNYRGTTWDGADDQADIEYYALSIDPTKTFLIAEGFAHANDEPPNWPNHTELGALDIADIRDQLLNDWPFVAGFMFWDRVKAPIYYPNPSALWNDPLVYNLSGTPDYDVENPNVLTDISFLGNFESGSIQPRDEAVDGFSIDVLSLDGTSKKVFDNGGLDADQSWGYDCYCTFGETPPDTPEGGSASFVSPRQGTTFFRQTLWRDKDYKPMNNESDDKPRIHLNTSWYVPFDGQSSDAKNTLRYNREYYIGFSIYLPENFEVDRTGKRTQVIQCQPKTWSITYRLQIVGNRAIPGVGSDYGDRWSIGYTRNEGHMEDFYTPAVTHNFDLGSIYDDLGKWTDFVIRYRHNPNMGPDDLDCSPISRRITGNAVTAYGADIILPPNEGIFQVWKTSGPVDINGNREFFGPYCDVTNSGVGCVPDGSFKRDDEDFTRPSPDGAWTSYRIYPGSWKRDPVSTNYGPRYVGWDEIRHGEVIRDGTTFESVNPGGLVQPTRPWLVGQLGTTQTSLQEAWENMVGHETVMYGKLIPDYILNSWSKWEGFYTAGTLDTFATWFQSRGMRDILLYCGYAMLPKITDTPGSSTNTDNDGLRDPTVWDRAASGVWDSHVHSLGQSIRQQLTDWGRDPEGYNFIMCLGHEMSGTWYSFSVGNKKSEYHETWNRWTSILKSYCPLMKFEWRPAKNKGKNDDGSTATFMEYMPQRNVDVVSLSHHDLTVYKTATNNYNFGNPQYADPAFPQRWRDHHVNGSSNPGQYCLNDLATAGRTLNKPIALGESRPQIGDCQTNWWTASPYPDAFIEYTYNWIESVKDIFWYELYLNSDCSRLDRTNWSAFEPDSGTSKAVLDPNLNIQDNYNRFRAKYLELYVPQLAKIDAAPSRLYENRPITDAK